ncbi:MAG: hypothetical protein ACTSQ4_07715 [Candidatus Heimdallarchaeaceae archaeon]
MNGEKNIKKKNVRKITLFSFILTTLMLSPILPATKITAATPIEIFDTAFDTRLE